MIPQLLGGAALATLWAWVLAALFQPRFAPRRQGTAVFVGLLGVALFGLRWNYAVFPSELVNPDESQMIAQAQAFLYDPIPWRGADGTTSGPLNSYLLMLPALVGAPVGYVSAHLITQLCGWITLACGYLALLRLVPRPVAGAALLAPLSFLCVTENFNFLHYSSERVPMLLTSGALLCLVSARPQRRGAWLAAGLLIGALPLAKMQTAPLALLFAAGGLGSAWWIDEADRRARIVAFGVGLLAVPALIFVMVWVGGVLWDAWMSYPVMMYYHLDISDPNFTWKSFLNRAPRFQLLWYGSIGVVVTASALTLLFEFWLAGADRARGFTPPSGSRFGPLSRSHWTKLALAALYFAVTYQILILSQRPVVHYFLFMIHPFLMFVGIALGGAWDAIGRLEGSVGRFGPAILTATVLATTGLPQLRPDIPIVGFSARKGPISRAVLQYARPGERLVVWGWEPRAYVETGLRMGTRDSLAQFSIMEGPLIDYYRQRFLTDFRASRPEMFVDAVAPGAFLMEQTNLNFETFPALREIIERDYQLVEEVGNTQNTKEKVRIYRRHDAAPVD